MLKLKRKLEENNFYVDGFAFDGDSTYNALHQSFFDKNKKIKDNVDFSNFSDVDGTLIICDPLHLLKRGRYRLLSNRIHCGFEAASEIVNITWLIENLNIPSIQWSNERFTKMNDELPIKLFSFDNLIILYEKKQTTALAYFLPLVFFNEALIEENLTNDERRNLLEISLYYMFI